MVVLRDKRHVHTKPLEDLPQHQQKYDQQFAKLRHNANYVILKTTRMNNRE